MDADRTKPKFSRIYSTSRADEIAFIKSLLDNADISYFIANENLHTLYGATTGFTAMDVMVPEDKSEETKELLKDIISPPKTP